MKKIYIFSYRCQSNKLVKILHAVGFDVCNGTIVKQLLQVSNRLEGCF